MITGTSGRCARTFGSISSPLMPGMLMSDKIRISDGSATFAATANAAGADGAGTADGTRPRHRARHRRRVCKRSMCASSICLCDRRPRQRDNEFGKCARLSIDVDLAAMLFHHDVVAHRQAKSGALARGFGGEEGIEHFLLYCQRASGAVIANPDFHPVAEVFRGRAERRLEALFAGFLALGGGVEAV